MESNQHICNYCNYVIETRGPWPYYNSAGQIQGLVALIYCPTCDRQKDYRIVEYEKPLKDVSDIWLGSVPRKTKMICYKCKNPVFLTLPTGSIRCPRCKKGTFEFFEPPEENFERSPVQPPRSPLRVKQNGETIRVPKPTVVIDSAEYMGYKFERFTNWFAGTVRRRLPVGDYTLLGMEEEVAVERKTLPDLVNSIIQDRKDFIEKCERLSNFKRKCLVVEGSLSSIKTPYEDSQAHPNAVLGSLLAAQERWEIPIYFLDEFVLAEEFVASMLSKYHAYRWLETNGFRRCLIEGDI